MLLFERLVLYKGWYSCLLEVLRDGTVYLPHVADEMELLKGINSKHFRVIWLL